MKKNLLDYFFIFKFYFIFLFYYTIKTFAGNIFLIIFYSFQNNVERIKCRKVVLWLPNLIEAQKYKITLI